MTLTRSAADRRDRGVWQAGSVSPRPLHDARRARLGCRDVDEATLVRRARDGDPEAFEALVRRHQDRAFTLALRLTGQAADAQDVTQAAFLAAWRRLPSFRGEAEFGTWLHRIVTNSALNLIRGRRRGPEPREEMTAAEVEQAATSVPTSRTGDPERQVEYRDLLAAVSAALGSLPEDLRICWVLRELEGRSYAEIEEMTGSPPDTVRGRIHRARTRMAEAMSGWR